MTNESTLCNIIARLVEHEKGGKCYTNQIYPQGEMDVLHIDKYGLRSYYEIKSSYKKKLLDKGINQVERAIRYKVCDKGYVLTPAEMILVGR